MKAILLLTPLLVTHLIGMDFKEFKQKALEDAPSLKGAALYIDLAQHRAKKIQRYENPSLLLQGGRFKPEDFSVDSGWDVGISQAIRLPSVGDALEDLAEANKEEAKAGFLYTKALFSKKLEKLYSLYVYEKSLVNLLKKEVKLSSSLENITKQRLNNGLETKAQRMMATLEKEDTQSRLFMQKNSATLAYLNLLSLANASEKTVLESAFIYPFNFHKKQKPKVNPTLLKNSTTLLKAQKEVASQAHTLSSVELFATHEQEPDQQIQRIGLGLSLPIFDRKKEEKQIAKVLTKQYQLKLEALEIQQHYQVTSLQQNLSHLRKQYHALTSQQKKQNALLKLFEEGYKISKGSLLELIDMKNRVIDKQRRLIQIQKNSNLTQIELNFIQGYYND